MSEEPIEPTDPVAPEVTSHPNNRSVNVGANTTFTSAATGDPEPTVQWEVSTDGSEWSDVSGATSLSYVLSGATLSHNGNQYRATFTNDGGTASSNAATLTVVDPDVAPSVTTHPSNSTINVGANTTFTAAASGDPTPTVQWEVSTDGSAWTNISGATNTTYSITSAGLNLNGNRYRAVFTNRKDSATTNAATLTVVDPDVAPSVTTHPSNSTVTEGDNASFTAAASGDPTPTVQWQESTNGSSWNNIPGATNATYSITSAGLNLNGRRYRAVFTNRKDSATTNAATLTVNERLVAPTITQQPSNQTAVARTDVTFTASASGNPSPSVQWEVAEGSDDWTPVSGATSGTLSLSSVALSDTGIRYRAVFTNSEGRVVSNAVTLTVVPSDEYEHHRFGWTHEVEVLKTGLQLWHIFFREGDVRRVPEYLHDMTDEEQIEVYGDVYFRAI